MGRDPSDGITEELKAKCAADNQSERFDQMLRHVLAVPKSELLKAEAKEKRRKASKKRLGA